MPPKISVIIPLYNKEKIVERSVNSVLSQSFNDFELIIVDDGSTDNSLKIVESIKDERIRIIVQSNGGPSKARNTGIKNAKADWLYFIDADDEMLPKALDCLWRGVINNSQYMMFCGEVYINNRIATKYIEGKLENAYKATFFNKLYQCSGSTLYHNKLCKEHMYDECIRRYEDLDCLFRKYRTNKVFLIDSVVAKINANFSSASNARKDISEDFVGHLDFRGKSFWEKMCLYKLYLGERNYYKKQIRKLYPSLHFRYDLLIMYKIIRKFYK